MRKRLLIYFLLPLFLIFLNIYINPSLVFPLTSLSSNNQLNLPARGNFIEKENNFNGAARGSPVEKGNNFNDVSSTSTYNNISFEFPDEVQHDSKKLPEFLYMPDESQRLQEASDNIENLILQDYGSAGSNLAYYQFLSKLSYEAEKQAEKDILGNKRGIEGPKEVVDFTDSSTPDKVSKLLESAKKSVGSTEVEKYITSLEESFSNPNNKETVYGWKNYSDKKENNDRWDILRSTTLDEKDYKLYKHQTGGGKTTYCLKVYDKRNSNFTTYRWGKESEVVEIERNFSKNKNNELTSLNLNISKNSDKVGKIKVSDIQTSNNELGKGLIKGFIAKFGKQDIEVDGKKKELSERTVDYREIGYDEKGNVVQYRKLNIRGITPTEASFTKQIKSKKGEANVGGVATLNYPILSDEPSTRIIGWNPQMEFLGEINGKGVELSFKSPKKVEKPEREKLGFEELLGYFGDEEVRNFNFTFTIPKKNSKELKESWKVISKENEMLLHHFDKEENENKVYKIDDRDRLKEVVSNYLEKKESTILAEEIPKLISKDDLIKETSTSEDKHLNDEQRKRIRNRMERVVTQKLKLLGLPSLSEISDDKLRIKNIKKKNKDSTEYRQKEEGKYRVEEKKELLKATLEGELVDELAKRGLTDSPQSNTITFLDHMERETSKNDESIKKFVYNADGIENSSKFAELWVKDGEETKLWQFQRNDKMRKEANKIIGAKNIYQINCYKGVEYGTHYTKEGDLDNLDLVKTGLGQLTPNGEFDTTFYVSQREGKGEYGVYVPPSKSAPLLNKLLNYTGQKGTLREEGRVEINLMKKLESQAFLQGGGQGAIAEGKQNLFNQLKKIWEGYKKILKVECEKLGYKLSEKGEDNLGVEIVAKNGEGEKSSLETPVLSKRIKVERIKDEEGNTTPFLRIQQKSPQGSQGEGKILETSVIKIDEENPGWKYSSFSLSNVGSYFIQDYLGSTSLFLPGYVKKQIDYDGLGRLRRYAEYGEGEMKYAAILDDSGEWKGDEVNFNRIKDDMKKYASSENIENGILIKPNAESEEEKYRVIEDGKVKSLSKRQAMELIGRGTRNPVISDIYNNLFGLRRDLEKEESKFGLTEMSFSEIKEKLSDIESEKISNLNVGGNTISFSYKGRPNDSNDILIKYDNTNNKAQLSIEGGMAGGTSLTLNFKEQKLLLKPSGRNTVLKYGYKNLEKESSDFIGKILELIGAITSGEGEVNYLGRSTTGQKKGRKYVPTVKSKKSGSRAGMANQFFNSLKQFQYYVKTHKLYEDIKSEPGNDGWFRGAKELTKKDVADKVSSWLFDKFSMVNSRILNAVSWITGASGARGEGGIWHPDWNYVSIVDSTTEYDSSSGMLKREFNPLYKELFITKGYDGARMSRTFSKKEGFKKWIDSLIGEIEIKGEEKLSEQGDYNKLVGQLWKGYNNLEPWEFYTLLRGNFEESKEKFTTLSLQNGKNYKNIVNHKVVKKYRSYLKQLTFPSAGDNWNPEEGQLTPNFREMHFSAGHAIATGFLVYSVMTDFLPVVGGVPFAPDLTASASALLNSLPNFISTPAAYGGSMLLHSGKMATAFVPMTAAMMAGQSGQFDPINFINSVDENFLTTYFYSMIFASMFNPSQLGVGSGQGGLLALPFKKLSSSSVGSAIKSNVAGKYLMKGFTGLFSYGDKLTSLAIGSGGASLANPRYLLYLYVAEGILEEEAMPKIMENNMMRAATSNYPTGSFGIDSLRTLAEANLRCTETFGSMAELTNPLESPLGAILLPGFARYFSKHPIVDILKFKAPMQ